ncbi:MAG: putative Ig domain-containing protein [bacterium]|nr:putative Ig domain-containing protein [bacterium]
MEWPNVQRTRTGAVPLPARLTGRVPLRERATAGRWWAYLFDNFEGFFPGYWLRFGTPTWSTTGFRASTGTRSIWCAASHYAPPGPYLNNMNAWIVDGPFNLRNTTIVEVYFDYFVDTQPVADTLFIGVSTDAVNFVGSAYSGYSAGWVRDAKISFNQFAGAESLYVGVQFSSDAGVVGEGAYVDNIELDGYIPSSARVDMAVRNAVVTDPVEEVFEFDVHNYGPATAASNSYTIDVYVDGVLDSSARNSTPLVPGATVTWEWQLAYIYSPGPHLIRVELHPDDGDIAVSDNALTFTMQIVAPSPVDLRPQNLAIISPAQGTFDFDVYNAGPGTARSGSYRVRVLVDGLLDSQARNSMALAPGQSATWQWQLAYAYPAGVHSIRVDVLPDLPDANPANNSLTFSWTVPQPAIITDLRLRRLKLKDPVNDVFTFQVINYGPSDCHPGDYEIRVYVDGLLDGSELNANYLYVGWIADWTWQLNYVYPPGLHVVTIEAWPLGADLRPRDNTQSVSLLEPGQNLAILPLATVTAVLNTRVSTVFTATNGAPPYSWRISAGALPAGLVLGGNGVLAGSATTSGTFFCTLEARDAAGLTAFAPLSIRVFPTAAALPPTLLDAALPPAFVNVAYAAQLTAVGGSAPYAWSPLSGFPPGTGLSTSGLLAGTPSLAGEFRPRVAITDSASTLGEAVLFLPVLPGSRYLSAAVRKCSITIPWVKHDRGEAYSDSLSFRAVAPLPVDFVLDRYTRLVVWIGDYALSFDVPRQAMWQRMVKFKGAGPGAAKARALITCVGQQLRISVSVQGADLATALAPYGLSKTGPATLIIPVRLSLNGTDTGQRSLQLSYRSNGAVGRLKLE